jgi:hypothetical protein
MGMLELAADVAALGSALEDYPVEKFCSASHMDIASSIIYTYSYYRIIIYMYLLYNTYKVKFYNLFLIAAFIQETEWLDAAAT